jgi:hypothetical protein
MIDLDASPDRPDDEATGPAVRPGTWRLIRVLAVAVLAMAGLTASAGPTPGLQLVLSAGGTAAAAFTLGADSLYTAHYGVTNPNSESGIRSWNLIDGTERWATALPQGVQNLVVREDAGVLMARSGTDPRISVLDPATGTVLWSSNEPSSVLAVGRPGLLFQTDVPGATVLRLAEPRTGRTLWTRTVDTRLYIGPDQLWSDAPDRIVTIGTSGVVTTLDFATGRVLSEGSTGGPLPAPGAAGSESVLIGSVGADRVLISRREQWKTVLTAYSLVPFRQVWQRVDAPAGRAADCAPVWCVAWARATVPGDPAGAGMSGLDPADGSERWRREDLVYAARFADHGLLGLDFAENPGVQQLDPASGRTLRSLGTSLWLGGDVLIRPDAAAAATAWVNLLGRGTTAPHTVGSIDTGAAFGCEASGPYLACPTADGPTKVWRLPLT